MPNPFRTFANAYFPTTMLECHRLAKWLWTRNDQYKRAIQNVVRYFINDITVVQQGDVDDTDDASVARIADTLRDTYDILNYARRFGEEQACMGICFVSAMQKIKRMLVCPHCGSTWALTHMRRGIDYVWTGSGFAGTCRSCGKRGELRRVDQKKTGDPVKVLFKSWPQEDICIRYNQITGTSKYYYKIPADVRNAIRSGDPLYLEETPWCFIEAAISPHGYLEFDDEDFLCLRNDNMASLDKEYKGWAPPLFLASFANILQLQLLYRFNESVALDYIAPIRLLSPPPEATRAGQDRNTMPISGAMFRSQMLNMVKGARNNPSTWFTSPFPVHYQMIGGEAKQLAPVELMEWQTAQLISGMNIPAELRQTSFQMVGPTMGLRMFERSWIHYARAQDHAVDWMARQIGKAEQWSPVKVSVDKTSFVEDEVNKNIRLQIGSGGLVSKDTMLKAAGLDYMEERKKLRNEREQEEEEAAKAQAAMQNQQAIAQAATVPPPGAMQAIGQAEQAMAAQQAGAAQPGAPMAPAMAAAPAGAGAIAATGNKSIAELEADAEAMAQQLFSMPETERRRQLAEIRRTDETYHGMVIVALDKIRSQAQSQGVSMARQGGM